MKDLRTLKVSFEVGSPIRSRVAERWTNSSTGASFTKYYNRKATRNFIIKLIEEHYNQSIKISNISFGWSRYECIFCYCEIINEDDYNQVFPL